MHYCKTAGKK